MCEYLLSQHQSCWTDVGQSCWTCFISLIRNVLSRSLVSMCDIIKEITRGNKMSYQNFSEGGSGLVASVFEVKGTTGWLASTQVHLPGVPAGSYMALLPAGCSTWSRQERYRNETWGKWNGNEWPQRTAWRTTDVLGGRNAHIKEKKKMATSNYLLHQVSHIQKKKKPLLCP